MHNEFWRVNSYSYPSYFSDNDKSREAWLTFLTFFDYSNYDNLKDFWASGEAPRVLNNSAIESWKATFEELGLVYVISRSNIISITPSGQLLKDSAVAEDVSEFVWIGVNLLIRYPLRGPRRSRSELHGGSNLFLYRFIFAALLELDGYLWWSEIERVLCRVFSNAEALPAVEKIKTLRDSPSMISDVDLPVSQRQGAFYNSLNQVCNHAGMNHLLFDTVREESPYSEYVTDDSSKRVVLKPEWSGLIKKALVSDLSSGLCSSSGSYLLALPDYSPFQTEQDYFDFIGASVSDLNSSNNIELGVINIAGESVHYLRHGAHFSKEESDGIVGEQASLCQLSRGQRVILSSNKQWTYKVVNKTVLSPGEVFVTLQRARPISNFDVVEKMLGDHNE